MTHNRPVRFDFYGLYNGVLTMIDRDSGSVWLQANGRAVKGPRLGEVLKRGPLLDTTWGEWKHLHPDTLVMAPEARYRDCYEPNGTLVERGFTKFPAPYFRRSLTHRDRRLPMFAMVLAVSLPPPQMDPPSPTTTAFIPKTRTLYRAYPVKAFRGKSSVINDTLGTLPVAVFFKAGTQTMSAVCRVVEGRTLTLEARPVPNGQVAFYDRETGTQWNIEGKAEKGPLSGKSLRRLDSYMSEWYGWVAYFPQTTIYGVEQRSP